VDYSPKQSLKGKTRITEKRKNEAWRLSFDAPAFLKNLSFLQENFQ